MRRIVNRAAILSLVLIGFSSAQAADDYLLGPEDVLSISVWERPELTRRVTIRAGGQITFPPLGDVNAAGLTTAGLARQLEERLYDFLRRPTQVTVEIVEFHSQRVTISGAIVNPGRLSFEVIPGLLDILGSAGGLGPEADLGRIQIFRRSAKQQTTITVDLSMAIREGDLSGLPDLHADDIIYVPGVAGEVGQGSGAAYVVGNVAVPGAYGVGPGLDLLKVIGLSGGTLPTADLSRVRVVGTDPAGETFVAVVDLARYLDSGATSFLVRPGDAVHVPGRENTVPRIAWSVSREILGVSRDILNLFLISDVLNSN